MHTVSDKHPIRSADAECIVLKEFSVADSVNAIPPTHKHHHSKPKLAWAESDDGSDTVELPSVPLSTEKYVCEVLIRRSQDEDCMVS